MPTQRSIRNAGSIFEDGRQSVCQESLCCRVGKGQGLDFVIIKGEYFSNMS